MECSLCGKNDHTAKQHNCSKCKKLGHRAENHCVNCGKLNCKNMNKCERFCSLCNKKSHNDDQHLCNICYKMGHTSESCNNQKYNTYQSRK